MKHLLKKGKLNLIISETGGGLSREVHLLEVEGKKYIVRRCNNIAKAKEYEKISKLFEKYGFLPKFLGRFGKDVFYEFIEGRNLTEKENSKIIFQLGQIAGQINKINLTGDISERFYSQLKELETGGYKLNFKERLRRNINKSKKFKAVIKKEEVELIKKAYEHLKKKLKPRLAYDGNDFSPDNFRVNSEGKVYLVDIEGIKPRVNGLGIAKFMLKWGKKKRKNKIFLEGYKSVHLGKFLTKEYLDFLFMNFLVQNINYSIKIFNREYKNPYEKLMKIVKKYI